jgi:hypothetical protein
MSTDRGNQTALTGFRNRQTTSDDLACLGKPGDCRSCGGDVSDEVLRVVGREGRVDACPRCYVTGNGQAVTTAMEAALRAHEDPTWPRERGGEH